jgi:hypothetical protein
MTAQPVFLLELLKPGGTIELQMAFVVANRDGKKSCLFLNGIIRNGNAFTFSVPYPVRESPVDIWKLPFGTLYW